MRIDGKLRTWNEEKGFGFIATPNGGQDIFVHVSDYPKRGGEPQIGEALSFEIALNREGKKKAVRVRRPASPRIASSREAVQHRKRGGTSILMRIVTALILVTLCVAGYKKFAPQLTGHTAEPVLSNVPAVSQPGPWRCDGRMHCSQMTSCSEAKYFLKNCPGTQMDGDGDGTPCEQQWCTSIFSK